MNINSNNSEERHRFENTQNDEQIMPEMRQREKFKDFNDQNVIQDYSRAHYYNHSRSRSRSRNRERSRSRERYRRDSQRMMIIEKEELITKEKEIII